jgi:hypothetical protein
MAKLRNTWRSKLTTSKLPKEAQFEEMPFALGSHGSGQME